LRNNNRADTGIEYELMATPSIILDRVSKRYRVYSSPKDRLREVFGLKPNPERVMEVNALRSISLTINKGEFCGVIGRNGAGKSTLLKIIAGQTSASEGTLQVFGRKSLLQLGLGFDTELTGRENVYNSLRFLFMSSAVSEEKVDEIIEFSELGDFINFPIKTYSSGMYSRLAFATGIAIDPDILIADEVLAVGDINFSQKCLARMRVFKDRGKTVILVTHDLGAVRAFCDRAILIERGELARDGEAVDVCEDYRNLMLYGALLPPSAVRRKTSAIIADEQATEKVELIEVETMSVAVTTGTTEPMQVPDEQLPPLAREGSRHDPPQTAADAKDMPNDQPVQSEDDQAAKIIQLPVPEDVDVTENWTTPRQETFLSVIDAGSFELVRIRKHDESRAAASVRGGSLVCFDLQFVLRKEFEFHSVGFTMHDELGQIVLHLNSEFVDFSIEKVSEKERLGVSFMFEMPRLRAGQYSFSYSANVTSAGTAVLAFKHDFDFALEIFYDKSAILNRQYGALIIPQFAVQEIKRTGGESAMHGVSR